MSKAYIDIDRTEKASYEAIMKELNSSNIADIQEKLENMVDEHPDYLDPYNTLYAIYQNQEDFKAADVVLNRAYNRAHLLILDDSEKWPELLEWKHTSNQHILRTIFNKAIDFWMDDNRADSLEVFEALLKMNPADEIGAKYYHLAVKLKFTFEAFMKRFMKDGLLDDSILDWYKENAR